ncbi:type I restriction enzyme HsdR N-terminal domain-containing protein [Novosphingobium sp.]|uniref:type I restriction enzyme HsdR N-terminal domain-containing protein n=1 Tax=Novosphingobium sp. TaxID=1874826 RepID=UPI0025CE4808|nr:type I restriction enzyme HsdR N-terminal domain-containing protein [Novosphingobium sp.]MCC6926482.1 type I restriction enzyme HsdR N-terminal domain-containing protein [Novosphingobium sp.]
MALSIKVPKKVADRIVAGIRRYQGIAKKAVEKDVSEADTVTIVKDMFCDIFGYDKYGELTSEQQIRGTYCDLAVKVGGKVHYLCEIKSAGTTLNENHIRQAVNYGAHNGIEWVILSNAISWKVYRIKFAQPIDWEEVVSFDMATIGRSQEDVARLYMLCREAITSETLDAFHRQAQIVNRYVIAETLLSEPVIGAIRKEFRRLFDGLKVADHELRDILVGEVIKRDALDSEPAKAARAVIKKAESSLKRKAAKAAKSELTA